MAEPARSSVPAVRSGSAPDHAGRAVVHPISRGAARGCSRPGCPTAATATLTFDYVTRETFVDALAPEADPRAYDLCRVHANRTRPPHGWGIEDRRPDEPDLDVPSPDDLASPKTVAVLAAALRGEPQPAPAPEPTDPAPAASTVEDEALAEFGHLVDDEPAWETRRDGEGQSEWGVEEAWQARQAEQAPLGAPRTVPAARRGGADDPMS